MQRFEFNTNFHNFEIVCTSRNTRDGFAHDAECFIDGNYRPAAKATAHYLNRTWENYCFQSVMQRLAGNKIRERLEWIREDFMRDRNYQRMTAKRKAEFLDYLDRECDDNGLMSWVCLYTAITNHGLMEPPYPEWYGLRPKHYTASDFVA